MVRCYINLNSDSGNAKSKFQKLIASSSYFKWNQALIRYFFNRDKAEQEVYLFVTKEDIVKVGKSLGVEGTDLEIYNTFFSAIRNGLPGTGAEKSILHHALWSYELWNKPFFF